MVKNFRKIVTVIQARMGSSRLPGKVMKEVCGKPLLLLMIERVQRASLAGTTVIATTTSSEDDIIADLCAVENIECFRGDPTDLLDRHYKTALKFNADIVLKIPSDCPLIDPEIIDKTIGYYLKNEYLFDYVSNLHPATYPDGNDVEVFSFIALHTAYKEAEKNFEREHTTPYLWNNPHKFRCGNVEWGSGVDYSCSHRFVLDYYEDYQFIKKVYEELYSANPEFKLQDILNLLIDKPEIKSINRHLIGLNWYKNHINELKNINLKSNFTGV
jgi:spore coat polysaccharide biosynthesis protein SpsF